MKYLSLPCLPFILIVIFFTFLHTLYSQNLNITVGSCVIQYSEVCASEFVKFYISTSDHPNKESYQLRLDNFTFPPWIVVKNDFKLIIHGYGGGIEYNQTRDIHEEYLKRNATNIIIVDWGRLALLPCYPTAAVNTKHAGECISDFLINLSKINKHFNPTSIHMVGFSLGAHVAGYASNALKKLLKKPVERITGLDPALPLFATSNLNRKLDSSDADFVDVIHTNAGIFGKIEPCGHVDFYVNSGQVQPQCNGVNNIPLCSHMMSTIYFKESITSDIGFWGVRCSSFFQYLFGWCGNSSQVPNSDIVLMGEKCSKKTHGIVFVYTNLEPPYAVGTKLFPNL